MSLPGFVEQAGNVACEA